MQQRKLYMKGTSLNAKFWVKLKREIEGCKEILQDSFIFIGKAERGAVASAKMTLNPG